ncbi:MAG: fatty acid desaturase [Thalassobius sp.]|nr:fatty acid desaturase [Thalassovita sp.]
MTVNNHISEPQKLRTGKDLILASKEYACEIPKRSWYCTLSTLLFLMLSFAATFINFHWTLTLGFSLLSALLIVRFFVIFHDYQHGAILRKSKLAKIIMTIFGIFVMSPASIWKRTHDHHHHHNSKLSNNGVGSYPLLCKEKYLKLSQTERYIYLAKRHPLTIFLGYFTLFIFDFNIKPIFKSFSNHWDSLVALLFHFTVAWLIYNFAGMHGLIFSWILPFFVAHGFGAYLFYAQHNFPEASFEQNMDWSYSNAALNSTSYLVMGTTMNWFTGNIGYHHVHHINHRIPFYRLKEAMKGMPELQNPKTTTLHPRDIINCLKLKVWDPEKRKMVDSV